MTRSSEQQPLLPSDSTQEYHHFSDHNDNNSSLEFSMSNTIAKYRSQTRQFLSSSIGHYIVLALISLDISSIFAEFLVKSLACDKTISRDGAEVAEGILGVVSLVFSSLFMIELAATIWAFGLRYFSANALHILDAAVILLSFAIDCVLLVRHRHPSSEGDSARRFSQLIILLRLWRVFKIVEELGVSGAQGQMVEPLEERVKELEEENRVLRERLDRESEVVREDGGREEV